MGHGCEDVGQCSDLNGVLTGRLDGGWVRTAERMDPVLGFCSGGHSFLAFRKLL